MKEIIRKFIYKIVEDAIDNSNIETRSLNLKCTSDLAQLMLDCKNSDLSLKSRDFLCRMNIHPDEFKF